MLSSRYPNNGFTARLGGHRKIYIISRQDKTTQQKKDRLTDQPIDTELWPLGIGGDIKNMTYCVTCDLLYDM